MNTKRKTYPPCLEIRHFGTTFSVRDHHVTPRLPYYYGTTDVPDKHDLVSYLAWLADRHPHTSKLPVRFINCDPVECGRKIL